MTAHIESHYSRDTLGDDAQTAFLMQWHDADLTARERESFPWSGQLWERVERATINDDALTEEQWGRMAVVRSTLGTRRTGGPTYDHSERGARLVSRQSYGIIRAGKLEWRSVHAEQGYRPYVHTGFEAGAL